MPRSSVYRSIYNSRNGASDKFTNAAKADLDTRNADIASDKRKARDIWDPADSDWENPIYSSPKGEATGPEDKRTSPTVRFADTMKGQYGDFSPTTKADRK